MYVSYMNNAWMRKKESVHMKWSRVHLGRVSVILLCPSIGSEFAPRKLNSISVIFCIHQTLPESFGIQLYTYSECLKNKTKGLYHENQLREDSRCGKLVFLIHMSDLRLHIVPRGPKKIQRAWNSTYIFKHTLYLYFQKGLQVWWGTEWLSCILSHNVTPNSDWIVTA
jgi:hypothetical protein